MQENTEGEVCLDGAIPWAEYIEVARQEVAFRIAKGIPSTVDRDELIGEAYLAAVRAVRAGHDPAIVRLRIARQLGHRVRAERIRAPFSAQMPERAASEGGDDGCADEIEHGGDGTESADYWGRSITPDDIARLDVRLVLSRREMQAVYLVCVNGLDMHSAAGVMGCSRRVVCTYISRARRKLKGLLFRAPVSKAHSSGGNTSRGGNAKRNRGSRGSNERNTQPRGEVQTPTGRGRSQVEEVPIWRRLEAAPGSEYWRADAV